MKHALKELFTKSSHKHRTTDDTAAFTPENPATSSSGQAYGHQAPSAAAAAACQADGYAQQQPGAGSSAAAAAAAAAADDQESSLIAVASHCPAAMIKERWSLDAFDICAKLYAGHISSVYRAIDKKSGITVGLKLYKRAMLNDMERHQIAREIWLHIQLNHPSIIALYAAWKDKDYIYLVLEWAPEGNVFTFLQQNGGRLPESVVVPMILEPTMSALHYIHELGMIHRDVKPENVLITTSYQIKLADFGLSIHANYEVANTRLGTIDYLSPEILDCPVKQHPQDHKQNPQRWYDCKVDVWSVGVLAYELLLGRTPFEARTPQETLYKIKTQEVAYPPGLSEGASSFIRAALVRDPEPRASLTDLLNHPWVMKYKRSASGPHLRSRTQTQSEVAVHCFGGHSLSEARSHASSGNMRPAAPLLTTSSSDGSHNSCPQVLHSQYSAPAGDLAAAARSVHQEGGFRAAAAAHQPSPLGQAACSKQLPAHAAGGLVMGALAAAGVPVCDVHVQPGAQQADMDMD